MSNDTIMCIYILSYIDTYLISVHDIVMYLCAIQSCRYLVSFYTIMFYRFRRCIFSIAMLHPQSVRKLRR